jgi:hypothetical protein
VLLVSAPAAQADTNYGGAALVKGRPAAPTSAATTAARTCLRIRFEGRFLAGGVVGTPRARLPTRKA